MTLLQKQLQAHLAPQQYFSDGQTPITGANVEGCLSHDVLSVNFNVFLKQQHFRS